MRLLDAIGGLMVACVLAVGLYHLMVWLIGKPTSNDGEKK